MNYSSLYLPLLAALVMTACASTPSDPAAQKAPTSRTDGAGPEGAAGHPGSVQEPTNTGPAAMGEETKPGNMPAPVQ